jgi:hypothetical protein
MHGGQIEPSARPASVDASAVEASAAPSSLFASEGASLEASAPVSTADPKANRVAPS